MAQERRNDDLKKLLAFIQQLVRQPENSWFADELRSMLSVQATEGKSMAKIEKYLGLDYGLDSATPPIDFSFVKNDFLRESFIADYREMLRFRFGLRGHKIDFSEYCRYALILAERALNLYYHQENNIDDIKSHILTFNSNARIENANSLKEIPFSVKLWSFCSEHKLRSVRETFDNVREVRNLKSHGAIVTEDDETWFQDICESYKKAGLPLRHNGTVDWKTLKTEKPEVWEHYQSEILPTPGHKRYIQLAWQREHPFDDIHHNLTELLSLISTLTH